MYMLIPGIPGSVRSPNHRGWHMVYSLSWGVSCPTTIQRPPRRDNNEGEEGHEKKPKDPKVRPKLNATRPSVSSMNIMKAMDSNSAAIIALTSSRRDFKMIELESINRKGFVAWNAKFYDAMIESYQISGSAGGDDSFTESMSISYVALQMTTASRTKSALKEVEDLEEKPDDNEAVAMVPFAKTKDILVRIFTYLDLYDLYQCSQVCKRFFFAACDDRLNVLEKHTAFFDCAQMDPTKLDGETLEVDDRLKEADDDDRY